MAFNVKQAFEILILVTALCGLSFVIIYMRADDDAFRRQIAYQFSQTLKANIHQERDFVKSILVSEIKNFKSNRLLMNNDLKTTLRNTRNGTKCSTLHSRLASNKQAQGEKGTLQNNLSHSAETFHSNFPTQNNNVNNEQVLLPNNASLQQSPPSSLPTPQLPYLEKYDSKKEDDAIVIKRTPNDRRNLDEEKEFMEAMRARMESRREHIKRVCQEQGLTDHVDKVRRDTYYLEGLKVYFCHVPKTGSKHWNKMLLHADTSLRNNHTSNPKKERFNFYKMKVRYGAKNISQVMKKDVLKMMVVREPFERLLSAYRDKLSQNMKDNLMNWSQFIHQQYSGQNVQAIANFSEFVAYITDKRFSLGKLNLHWRKYRALCQPCAINYDIIGHHETIDEDARYLLKLIDAPDDVKLSSAEHLPTDAALVRKFYRTVRPKENLLKLYEVYEDDFMLFNYNVSDVLAQL